MWSVRRRGLTLAELILTMLLLAMLAAVAMPSVQRVRDALAVRAARDALAAQIAATRWAAVSRGGASLVLEPASTRAWIEDAREERLSGPVELGGAYGVTLHLSRPAERVEIRFDGLGIGRVASQTIRLRRGRSEAGLTISAYGRVRKW